MDIAMGILKAGAGVVADAIKSPAPTPSPKQVGTAAVLEKLEAGREILKLMEEQQRQNLEYARMFADLAKSVGWPQNS